MERKSRKTDIEYICQHHLLHKIRILLRAQRIRQHNLVVYISFNYEVNKNMELTIVGLIIGVSCAKMCSWIKSGEKIQINNQITG